MGSKPRVKRTHVACVVDRSGSMHRLTEDTIGGFNNFLNNQKKDAKNTTMTLVLFDHEYATIYKGDMSAAPALDERTYVPRGATALLDAIGQTIHELNPQVKRNDSVVVMILTDGFENSSRKYHRSDIQDLITQKRKDGWEFVFLAANEDAIATASNYGIGLAVSTQASGQGVNCTYATMDYVVSSSKSGAELSSQNLQRTYNQSLTVDNENKDFELNRDQDLTNNDLDDRLDDNS